MNIALIAQSGVFGPLHSLVRRWLTHRAPARWTAPASPHAEHHNAPKSVALHAGSTRATTQNTATSKPLRVVRVLEAGQTRASSGRMVISGRMADVCAELDRLAARESALS